MVVVPDFRANDYDFTWRVGMLLILHYHGWNPSESDFGDPPFNSHLIYCDVLQGQGMQLLHYHCYYVHQQAYVTIKIRR